ncbi:S46 family peptidase [Flocculibacter collagenilyticus]|uniref:S46 family peptidase n=1 Tax=Flocculibacter collagenilyticus TaxID=2744479 RepID=UPI0018F6A3F4|nr:S46 family peptidase [Flocculibacter collagenilyticus]
MRKLTAITLLASSFMVQADEGMWQPNQLPQIKQQLKAKGLEIAPEKISSLTEFPMNAVISLGGCTASFVSPKGLVVTNHHCAYGSIQYNSSADNNLIDKGFLAKDFSKELPGAPGSRIYVTESLVDVTDKVVGKLSDELSGEARFKAIEKTNKALVSECEKDEGYRCEIYSYYGGAEYFLIKQLAIRDVRLVYAPPASIGKFGGDTDNWMWPRHTGDWSFYRAYVNKDGQPADFHKDNVPYEPKSHLKVSAKGVDKGDFVMVTGYPGRTNRYRTAQEVENQFTWVYPTAKQYREDFIETIKQVAPEGSEARIKYESSIAGLANYAKNYGSMVESYQKGDMLARKKTLEAELNAWVNASDERKAEYGQAIDELNELIEKSKQHQARDLVMAYMARTSMLSTAKRLYRLAHEKQKPDADRDPGYQERDMTRFTEAMKRVSRRYHPDVDQAVLLHFIKEYSKLPKSERVAVFDRYFGMEKAFNEEAVKAKIAAMYDNTKLGNEEKRLALMDAKVEDFKNSFDPFLMFAVAMYDYDSKQREADKALKGELQQARPQYMRAILAYNKSLNKPVYADANSSLRVTYGTVKGYSPKDGMMATPFTTLEGLRAKYIEGDAEFNVSAKQLKAIDNKQYGRYFNETVDSVPVNFLSTVDTTGGNSGSPTLNGKAELVGLLFDGVYESIIGDWDYDPSLNRSIHADSRYMLWVMEYVDGADNLIKEMDIVE